MADDKISKTAYNQAYYLANKAVINKRSREWYKNNREKIAKQMRNYHLQRSYGISEETFEQMCATQNNMCLICSQIFSCERKFIHIDHCHKTGRIRGILCNHCNNLLGHAKENITILKRAVEYLNG